MAILISGKVVSDKTENPLDVASVFLNNTTFGTLTNAKGEFKLDAPCGHYQLIVTYIGYITYNKDIDIDENFKFLSIDLIPKSYSISEIIISANVKGWALNFARFKKIFLGNTPNSRNCEILNPHSVKLSWDKSTNTLEAYSDTFIIVKNYALGYIVKYKLEIFQVNSYSIFYYGYPLFEDISTTLRHPKAILKRRNDAYEGSVKHFLRSLYFQTIEKEGFIIKETRENSQDSSKKFFVNVMMSSMLVKKAGNKLIQTETPLSFYNFLRDTLKDVKVLFYPDPFEVDFLKKEDFRYKENFSLYWGMKRKKVQQTSILNIRSKIFIFDKNGVYLKESDLLTAGYMGWKRIADMLPDNYEKPPISAK